MNIPTLGPKRQYSNDKTGFCQHGFAYCFTVLHASNIAKELCTKTENHIQVRIQRIVLKNDCMLVYNFFKLIDKH